MVTGCYENLKKLIRWLRLRSWKSYKAYLFLSQAKNDQITGNGHKNDRNDGQIKISFHSLPPFLENKIKND
jgi:hypothetical protein